MTDDDRLHAHAGRATLCGRLALAYDVDVDIVERAMTEQAVLVDDADAAFERDGTTILFLINGEPTASVDLAGSITPPWPACETLDPYGDRRDDLTTPAAAMRLGTCL